MQFRAPPSFLAVLVLASALHAFPAAGKSRIRRSTRRYPTIDTTDAVIASKLLMTISMNKSRPHVYTSLFDRDASESLDRHATSIDDAFEALSYHDRNFTSGNINFKFSCNLPNQTDPSWSSARDIICELAQVGLMKAALRIQQIISIATPITASVLFGSDCLSACSDNEDTLIACHWNKVLGAAAPSGWHEISKEAANSVGLDDEFLYPSALLRQYLPNDTSLTSNPTDIVISLNTDTPWWFPTPDNPRGDGIGNGGSYGPPLIRTRTREFGKGLVGLINATQSGSLLFDETMGPTEKVYDFEQTVVHEMMHGFGFESGWSPSGNAFLPGSHMLVKGADGVVTGVQLSKSYIFDKTLEHAGTGIMMRDYARAIRLEAARLSSKLLTANKSLAQDETGFLQSWNSQFQNSKAWQLGVNLQRSVASTPMQLLFWYRSGYSIRLEDQYTFSILYTPQIYDGGSSVSHLDATVYGGSGDYIMRPFCTTGSGIDAMTPHRRGLGVMGTVLVGMLKEMGYLIM